MTDAEVKETFEYMLAQAHHALSQGGSFVPFGAGVHADGARAHVALDGPEADVQAAIAALVSGLKDLDANQPMAVAGLAFDAEITLSGGGQTRAVCMHLETRAGAEGIEAFTPYVREADGAVILYDPIVSPSSREIFA